MATITSHTLNGSNGTHADGITVILKNLSENREVFQTKMDIGGRLNKIVDPEEINENSTYELIFLIGEYWKNFYNDADKNVVDETAAKDLLDRAGYIKTEKVNVESSGGLFVLPAKEGKNE